MFSFLSPIVSVEIFKRKQSYPKGKPRVKLETILFMCLLTLFFNHFFSFNIRGGSCKNRMLYCSLPMQYRMSSCCLSTDVTHICMEIMHKSWRKGYHIHTHTHTHIFMLQSRNYFFKSFCRPGRLLLDQPAWEKK